MAGGVRSARRFSEVCPKRNGRSGRSFERPMRIIARQVLPCNDRFAASKKYRDLALASHQHPILDFDLDGLGDWLLLAQFSPQNSHGSGGFNPQSDSVSLDLDDLDSDVAVDYHFVTNFSA